MNAPQQAEPTLNPTAMVSICGVNLAPIEYRGKRVMTLAMMDEVHQRPEGTARRNFNEHRAKLIDGQDFHEVTADEIRTHELRHAFAPRTAKATLLTETGYSMIVKSFTDDLAWNVQRQLVNSYFKRPATTPDFDNKIAMAYAWIEAAKEAETQKMRADQEAARRQQLEHQVTELAPAAAGFDRIANTDKTQCITDAAKTLQIRPRQLFDLLLQKKWIHLRPGKKGYIAYQEKIQAGYLTHKQAEYEDPNSGELKVNDQVRVTQRGLTKLALLIGAQAAPPSLDQHHLN
jgi:phage antirepressor YoqD-like protein